MAHRGRGRTPAGRVLLGSASRRRAHSAWYSFQRQLCRTAAKNRGKPHGRPVGTNHCKFLSSHPRVPDDGRLEITLGVLLRFCRANCPPSSERVTRLGLGTIAKVLTAPFDPSDANLTRS